MPKVFDAIISVVDESSAQIMAIEKHLNAMGGAAGRAHMQMSPHEKLFHQIRESGGEARHAFGEAGNAISEVGGRVGEVLPVLGGLGAVASLAGMVELVQRTSEASLSLQHMAITAGMTTQQLQTLDYVGQQVGVSSGDIATAMGRLNQRLGQAAVGQMKPLTKLLAHLGIATRDAHGHLRDAAQLMPQLENVFAHMKSPVEQNAVAFELFGRSYQEILPLLDLGQKKFQALQQQFSIFGYTIQPADFESLQEFGDSWENMNTAVQGLLTDIASHLAPVLTPLINEFSRWIGINKDWIATDIASTVQTLGTALENVPWARVGHDLQGFLDTSRRVFDAMGGLRTVAIGLGAVIGISLAAQLVMVTQAVAGLGLALGGPLVKVMIGAGMAVGGLVVDLVAMLPLVKDFTTLWAALDAVLAANPLGLVVLGVAALGVAGYELYEHWAVVKAELGAIWQAIGRDFDAVFGPIMKAIDTLEGDMKSLGAALPGGGATPDGPGVERTQDGRYFRHPGFRGGYFSPAAPDVAGAGSGNGKVQMEVNFNGAPPGTSVSTTTSGGVAPPKLRLGYNSMAGHN